MIIDILKLGIGVVLVSCVALEASAETRTYTYNARGELLSSGVTGGPANGVQTAMTYDKAGNRLSYQTTGSTAPIRFSIPIVVPLSGLTPITIPQ